MAEIDEMLTEVVDRLASASVSEVVDRERRRQLVPYGRWGHLRSVLAARDLTQDSLVRWVTVAPRMQPLTDEPDPAGQDTDVTRVLLADRVLRLPTRAVPTVAAISTALDGIRIADLPGLDPASRLVVVRRLIREGACVLVSP